MKILILGSRGQVGKCLVDKFANSPHEVFPAARSHIDIANFESTQELIAELSPDLVINAAAFTHVDKAEHNTKIANVINHLATLNIANACKKMKSWLIHLSTDYVFDGTAKDPYKENDETNPLSVYGNTKLDGELAIISSGCKYIILRTEWIFSEYGSNFLKTMLLFGSKKDEISIIDDQIGCPTYAQDIAISIIDIVSQLESKQSSGIYHFCGKDPCSWYGFANEIFKQAKLQNIRTPIKVNPIKTSAFPTAARRPAFSVLDCSKIEKDFGIQPSNWQDGIRKTIKKINQ